MAAYGSAREPNFTFVMRAEDAHLFDDLIGYLARRYELNETTDFNTDAGRVVSLRSDNEELSLWLSFVGRYAVLVRVGTTFEMGPVVTEGVTRMELDLVQVLKEHDLYMLTREQLEHPVRFALQNTSPTRARMFNVLFSDTDFLPWERPFTT